MISTKPYVSVIDKIIYNHIVVNFPTVCIVGLHIYSCFVCAGVNRANGLFYIWFWIRNYIACPDIKVHGANMGPTWSLSAQDGPHVGPMNLVIGIALCGMHLPRYTLVHVLIMEPRGFIYMELFINAVIFMLILFVSLCNRGPGENENHTNRTKQAFAHFLSVAISPGADITIFIVNTLRQIYFH